MSDGLSGSQLRGVWSIAVNVSWIEGFVRFLELQRMAGGRSVRDGAIETTAVTDMATCSTAGNLDTQPDAVLVIVDTDFADTLDQAAGCPFAPEALAAATPVMSLAGLNGQAQCFLVHVGVHEKFATRKVSGSDWNDAVAVEFGRLFASFFDLLYRAPWVKSDWCLHIK